MFGILGTGIYAVGGQSTRLTTEEKEILQIRADQVRERNRMAHERNLTAKFKFDEKNFIDQIMRREHPGFVTAPQPPLVYENENEKP